MTRGPSLWGRMARGGTGPAGRGEAVVVAVVSMGVIITLPGVRGGTLLRWDCSTIGGGVTGVAPLRYPTWADEGGAGAVDAAEEAAIVVLAIAPITLPAAAAAAAALPSKAAWRCCRCGDGITGPGLLLARGGNVVALWGDTGGGEEMTRDMRGGADAAERSI